MDVARWLDTEDGLIDATQEADAEATRLARQKSRSSPSEIERLEGPTTRLAALTVGAYERTPDDEEEARGVAHQAADDEALAELHGWKIAEHYPGQRRHRVQGAAPTAASWGPARRR